MRRTDAAFVSFQQKTPWPFGSGGRQRTRCGVRRQV